MSNASDTKKSPVGTFFSAIGNVFKEIGVTFVKGDWKTKLSYIIMGFGPIMRGQFLRGGALLAVEALFIWFIITFGHKYFLKLGTLGTIETQKINRKTVYGDHSFLILLFGLLTLFFILFLVICWYLNIRENAKEEALIREGKKLPGNKADFLSLFDNNFDKHCWHFRLQAYSSLPFCP